jgi:DNA-binding response OmpR family regulator
MARSPVDQHAKGEVVLVVDDNTGVRSAVAAMLQKSGYTVYTAADGRQGLICFELHQSRVTLLLTDITMPNMDGMELARRVLERQSGLPVLFMSGGADDRSNGFEVLRKPFTSDELLAAVRGTIHKTATSASLLR